MGSRQTHIRSVSRLRRPSPYRYRPSPISSSFKTTGISTTSTVTKTQRHTHGCRPYPQLSASLTELREHLISLCLLHASNGERISMTLRECWERREKCVHRAYEGSHDRRTPLRSISVLIRTSPLRIDKRSRLSMALRQRSSWPFRCAQIKRHLSTGSGSRIVTL